MRDEQSQYTREQRDDAKARRERIGLALSGGGFRASIFHLGVLRRLEELGIMDRVSVISAVSGGSIIAAYYAYAMEEQLRLLPPEERSTRVARLQAHERVAKEFLTKVRYNLRSRALVFSPFYHPLLFVKSLFLRPFQQNARSILIQAEYDKHFYKDYTLDQLPAIQPGMERKNGPLAVLTGPKLLLNTTSLMTGERKAFSRDANTYLSHLKTSNKNVLKLSQVVGASSGVPVLFPPTAICGELLVDGGVSDNQGIEGLLPVGTEQADSLVCPAKDGCVPCGILLISDACGQLELKHTLSIDGLSVFGRVNEVLQHQVRSKLLELLTSAYDSRTIDFAFIHLLLNLKDDGSVGDARVPTEFLEPLARVRTDLDQFSYVESEALMYHGYTLIDAMIKRWWPDASNAHGRIPLLQVEDYEIPLSVPPLFQEKVRRSSHAREAIRQELLIGSEKLFLLRCWRKFGWKWLLLPYGLSALIWAALVSLPFAYHDALITPLIDHWDAAIVSLGDCLGLSFDPNLAPTAHAVQTLINALAGLLSISIVVALPGYLVFFALFSITRRLSSYLDKRRYRNLTGCDPESLEWLAP
jgi:predicted acylesterase/phospholipase RssA